ncbi:maleylpyruvate isomerase family mycothiol-dependent enzyme [Streptomyces sp. NPDC005808]|uniref:maleylpyruvate isomerase family mycothiol-dependent enzyme n=1 Tax=Streptomyces sp. NPDC005808 TaxID=3364734 RepID=UPI0036880E3C
MYEEPFTAVDGEPLTAGAEGPSVGEEPFTAVGEEPFTAVGEGLGFERCCAEIVTQAGFLAAVLPGADLAAEVPSCPGWTVNQLVRHLGGGQRWAEEIVRTRAAQPPPDLDFRDLSPYAGEDPVMLADWLTEGAEQFSATLRKAGPDADVWTPLPRGPRNPYFFARRMTHETALHRADAVLALKGAYVLAPEVAADGLDEWMELGSLPEMLDFHPGQRELLGPGRTLRFEATDVRGDGEASWLVDLTGDVLAWRRSAEPAAVTVRGPLSELLLAVYRRRSVADGSLDVEGDAGLLDFWLERVAFG